MKIHTVRLNKAMLSWLQNELENGRFEPEDDQQQMELDETINQVGLALADIATMERSTKLLETDDFIAYENPVHGDNAPVVIWDKAGINGLDLNTPFFDVGDQVEMTEWLMDMRRAALD